MHEHSAFVLLDELLFPALWLDQNRKMHLSYPFHTTLALFLLLQRVNLSVEALFWFCQITLFSF